MIVNVDLESLVDAVHRGVAGDGHHIVGEEDFSCAARCVVVVELDLDDVAFFVEVGLCGIESGQTFHFSAVVCHVPDCHCACFDCRIDAVCIALCLYAVHLEGHCLAFANGAVKRHFSASCK